MRCIVPHGVAQHCGVVARRRELQGHGVALAGAQMAVAAARTTSTSGRSMACGIVSTQSRRYTVRSPPPGRVQLFQLHHTSSLYTPQRPSG